MTTDQIPIEELNSLHVDNGLPKQPREQLYVAVAFMFLENDAGAPEFGGGVGRVEGQQLEITAMWAAQDH